MGISQQVPYHLAVISGNIEAIKRPKILSDLPWPKINAEEYEPTIRSAESDLVVQMAATIAKMVGKARAENLPDYRGQFLHNLAEASLSALNRNDVELLKEIFPVLFVGSMGEFDALRPEASSDPAYLTRTQAALAPILDLMEISGQALTFAELHGNEELWATVQRVWDKYIAAVPGSLSQLSLILNYGKPRFAISPHGMVRFSWSQALSQRLAGLPGAADGLFTFSKARDVGHKSALIRYLASRAHMNGRVRRGPGRACAFTWQRGRMRAGLTGGARRTSASRGFSTTKRRRATMRRNRQRLQAIRRDFKPRGVRFWRGPSQEERSATLHMFTQDIAVSLMPRAAWSRRRAIRVTINGSEEGTDRALLLLESLSGDNHYEVEDTVASAVDRIAQYLAAWGEVVLEVLRNESGEAVAFSAFTPDSVHSVGLGWLQWIPAEEREHMKQPKRALFFPRSSVFRITVPRPLGGRGGHRRLVKRLIKFDSLGPKFVQTDLEAGKWPAEVEFGSYHRSKRILDYILTNRWGWNARDTSLQYVTEFYQVWRWLRFQKALSILRQHVLHELNSFFSAERIGATIVVEGVPEAKAIALCESDLLAGRLGFKEVYGAFGL